MDLKTSYLNPEAQPFCSSKSKKMVKRPHEKLSLAQPTYMQQQIPANFSNFYYCLYSYETHFQPQVYHFYSSFVTYPNGHGVEEKRVMIEELETTDNGDEKLATQQMVKENEKYVKGPSYKRSTMPPRLIREKGHDCFGVFDTKIGPKQIWRPKYLKSDNDGIVASLPLQDDLLCKHTTVMIKNVPNQFRRDTLMGFLDDFCRKYKIEYDFLYLPMDFRRLNNLGYAFVNFTTAAAAFTAKEALEGFEWEPVYGPYGLSKSKKVCKITWARIQGKEALVKHFERSQFICKTNDYLPVVFNPPRNGSSSTSLRTVGKLYDQTVSPWRGRK